MRLSHAFTGLALLLTVACSSKDSITGTDGGNVTLANGSMSAKVNGSAWRASLSINATYSNSILAFAGTDGALTLGIGVVPSSGPGTYPVGQSSPTNAILTYSTGGSWGANVGIGSGSVTIKSISSNEATGTFTFTLGPVGTTGSSNTKAVTEGTFDVKF